MPGFGGLTCILYLWWLLESAASDYFQFDDLLKPEEQAIRMKVRECMEKNIAPIMTQASSFSFCFFKVFNVNIFVGPPRVNMKFG